MKCKQVQTALAIAPREWSEAERQQIEAHLPTCATCAAIARDYDRQTDQLTALPRLSLSMAQQQTIMSQVARIPQYPWSRRLGNAFGAAAGVLLLGVLVVSLLWLFNHPTSLSLTATVTSVLTPTMISTPALGSTSPTPAPPTLFPRQPTPRPTIEEIKGAYEAIPGPGFSPYVFVLTSTLPNTELKNRHYQVGQIEVLQKGNIVPAQVLSVEFERPSPIRPGLEPDWLESGLRIEDVNFDGYSDISIYELGGVGWGIYHWWLFDKDTGRFYTNTLTSELSDLQPGGIAVGPMYIDPLAQEIHVNTLFATCISTYVYGVAQEHLILKSKWEYKPGAQTCDTATVTSVLTPTMTSTPALGSTSPTSAPPTLFPRQPTLRPTSEEVKGAYEAIPGPGFSPYVFVLTSTLPNIELRDRRYQIGQIEIWSKGSTAPAQVLSVEFHRPEPTPSPGLEPYWLKGGLRIEDVNFDGYSDISIHEIGGAEWGYHHWWLFDKDTGRFYTNTLTSELRDLDPGGLAINRMYIDPAAQEIHVNTLFATCLSTYVYEVVQEHLVLKSKWEYKRTHTCNLVTETSDLTATMTATSTILPATATAAPIEPTQAPPSPASPSTGMLPDGIFATATPVVPDPVYATQEAAYQATREASSATPIARAVASPFPAAGPNVASVHATLALAGSARVRGCFSSGMSGLGCEA